MEKSQNCSIKRELAEDSAQNMFNRITSKWAVQVLVVLKEERLRFSQLKKHLHTVTDRMLIKHFTSSRLTDLSAEKFLKRTVKRFSIAFHLQAMNWPPCCSSLLHGCTVMPYLR